MEEFILEITSAKQNVFEVDRALLDKVEELDSKKEVEFDEVLDSISKENEQTKPNNTVNKDVGDLSIYYNNLSVMADVDGADESAQSETKKANTLDGGAGDSSVAYNKMMDVKVPEFTGESSKYDSIIKEMSEKHGVDYDLIKHVMKTESNFNHSVVSSAGAAGLMQLMPATAKYVGVKDRFDVRQNIEGGVKYLRKMYDQHNGDLVLTLAAYNAGPGNVKKYGGVPPFKETQNYIKKILNIDVTK